MSELPHLPLIKLTSDLPRHKRQGYPGRIPRKPEEREEFCKKAHKECDDIFADFNNYRKNIVGILILSLFSTFP
jgi:hypothetical protein